LTKLDLIQSIWKGRITKGEMGRPMRASRSELDRLLDPDNTKIRLDMVYRSASAVGRRVRLELVEEPTG